MFRPAGAMIVETRRLLLRRLTVDDATIMLALLNDPGFLHYVGDRGVRTLTDARDYLERGPIASYAEHGFGMYLVELRDMNVPVGICGLVRRASLAGPDIGFAFLPEYRSRGYAVEAAAAVLDHARDALQLVSLAAIVHPENAASRRVLEHLGFVYESLIRLSEDAPETMLWSRAL